MPNPMEMYSFQMGAVNTDFAFYIQNYVFKLVKCYHYIQIIGLFS